MEEGERVGEWRGFYTKLLGQSRESVSEKGRQRCYGRRQMENDRRELDNVGEKTRGRRETGSWANTSEKKKSGYCVRLTD